MNRPMLCDPLYMYHKKLRNLKYQSTPTLECLFCLQKCQILVCDIFPKCRLPKSLFFLEQNWSFSTKLVGNLENLQFEVAAKPHPHQVKLLSILPIFLTHRWRDMSFLSMLLAAVNKEQLPNSW